MLTPSQVPAGQLFLISKPIVGEGGPTKSSLLTPIAAAPPGFEV